MICYWGKVDSPIGEIHLAATDEGLVYCASARQNGSGMHDWLAKYLPGYKLKEANNDILNTAKEQLKAYFSGEGNVLDVPLKLVGTTFRKTVWKALMTIPYGETRTYGQIASQIGNPKGSRAVGQANHYNPVSYFVPCHRVIGAGGTLVGFGGGLDAKSWLLSLEGIDYKYDKKETDPMKMTVKEVLDILSLEYPNPKSELYYHDTFSLLIAVILSAQATDISVNKVTPNLFKVYPDAYSLAKADIDHVMEILKTIGLYKNKSKFIIETSKKIVNDFEGKVPQTREELITLPGVGRKTANVVLAEGFGIPAIAVDTHVSRVAKRLGWADEKDSVLEIEKKLMKIIPKDRWAEAHHQILLLGRYHSTARDTRDIYEVLNELKEKHECLVNC